MSEFFVNLDERAPRQLFPGVVARTTWLEKIMLSLVDLEPGAVVAEHHHPHEQMGTIISGRAEFTIGGETKILSVGDFYRIPGGVAHKVVALEGPVRALDVFAPVREEYK